MSREIVTLGFKAFDAHELLCHFLAERSGYYRDAGLQVELADITFTPDADLPDKMFQASCGAAFLAGLKSIRQRILFVAVDRPMFWLYARDDIDSLHGGRIATFPPIAPPWHFTRILLARHGLDADTDVTLLPARDDIARLGLLRSGNADAAILSSAISPARVEELGYCRLACLGDAIRIPTTGLACHANTIEQDPELVKALVNAHLRSLQQLHGDPEAAGEILADIFDIEAPGTTELFMPCFTPDGRMEADAGRAAIDFMAQALELAETPAWEILYDPSFVQ